MPTQLALSEIEPNFKSLVEGGTDVIWSAEIDGPISYLSPQFKTLFGIEPQDWIGRVPFELVHPDDVMALKDSIDQQNGSQNRVSVEFRHLCHDGSYLWVEGNAIPIFDEDGNMVCRQGTIRDISARKRMEQEQGRLLEILQSTSDFVGICQPDVGVLWQNQPFRNLRPDLDTEGLDCSDLYPDWAFKIVKGEGLTTAEERGIWSGETALLDSKGNEIPTSQVIIAHKSDAGELEYFSTILRDISQIKATELALRDAQAELRCMADNVPGVISRVLLRPDGSMQLMYVSHRIRELFELDPEDLLADMNEVWKRIHPDDLEQFERAMQHSAKTLEPYHVAYRLVLEEKGTRWVVASSLPSRQDNGDIVFDSIVIDVTELGRLESLERDINFKQIFDNAPDAVFLIAAEGEDIGRIVAANKAAEHMHGYGAGQLKGKSISELDAPEDARHVPDRLRRLANGEVLRFEINHLHKDGSVFPVEVTASRIRINGRPYVLAFDRDVTERMQAEAERSDLQNQLLKSQKLAAELDLTKTQSHLRRMTENIPGMVCQYVRHADGTDSATFISTKCREIMGVEPEEVLEDAEVLWRWIEPEDVPPMREELALSARTLERFAHEFRVAVPGQGIRWCNAIGQPERKPNGDVVWDGLILDVTDRREVELANEALAKATESKDQFLANMSHELRTPLSAILGMTEGLKQGLYGETTERQLETLGVVEESSMHLLELINEILDLAKIETGNSSLNLSNVNVAELCKSCLDLVSPQATQKQIKLSLNADWNLQLLRADKTRLRQILINLLGNAIKFTPDGGEVKLEIEELPAKATASVKETLRFIVSDNGIGIEPSRIDSVFEPFVQVDSSFSRKYPGTGLGLSLVKRFVELHSGTVTVQSEPGKGSRFTVDLPFAKESQSGYQADTMAPADSHVTEKADSDLLPQILFAEDNDHVAMAITPILEASGFDVLRAINGKVAVKLAKEHSLDLILMDVQMPVMDGLEAIRQIRSLPDFADTPIIALSGFAMPEDSSRCIEAGANSFVTKPCKMPELISKIRQVLSSCETNIN